MANLRKYNVYTSVGDYLGIWAYDIADAKRQIMRITFGRAQISAVVAA